MIYQAIFLQHNLNLTLNARHKHLKKQWSTSLLILFFVNYYLLPSAFSIFLSVLY